MIGSTVGGVAEILQPSPSWFNAYYWTPKAERRHIPDVAATHVCVATHGLGTTALRRVRTSETGRKYHHCGKLTTKAIQNASVFSSSPGNQNPGNHIHPDDAEQQAALLLACSGDNLPPSLPPVNMYDLLEALQIHREVIPSHTVYALNIERIIMKLWHPTEEELQQDVIHRQRLTAREGLLY
ncbi:transcriptional adapter 1 [Hyperolius riggenbachi]|uniref:transcriptional adapter 1 n=1 Tax=Hyperolius riggenbachi TaxID=752182 RepID=UPI0035A2D5F3